VVINIPLVWKVSKNIYRVTVVRLKKGNPGEKTHLGVREESRKGRVDVQ